MSTGSSARSGYGMRAIRRVRPVQRNWSTQAHYQFDESRGLDPRWEPPSCRSLLGGLGGDVDSGPYCAPFRTSSTEARYRDTSIGQPHRRRLAASNALVRSDMGRATLDGLRRALPWARIRSPDGMASTSLAGTFVTDSMPSREMCLTITCGHGQLLSTTPETAIPNRGIFRLSRNETGELGIII